MFDKLKYVIFGDPLVTDITKKIIKQKLLSPKHKYGQIVDLYIHYFNHKLKKDAKHATYELDYEKFMDKYDKKDPAKFEECYHDQLVNFKYCYLFTLMLDTKKMENLGLDAEKLTDEYKHVYEIVKEMQKTIFEDQVYADDFYTSKKVREKVSKQIDYYIELINQKPIKTDVAILEA